MSIAKSNVEIHQHPETPIVWIELQLNPRLRKLEHGEGGKEGACGNDRLSML